jgi:hypothetical protein
MGMRIAHILGKVDRLPVMHNARANQPMQRQPHAPRLLNYTGLCLGIHVFQRAQREARDVIWGGHTPA